MIILCFLLTSVIFTSFYYLLSGKKAGNVVHNLLTSFLLACAQIILTELLLGLMGGLYLPRLVFVNLMIASIVFWYGYHSDRRRNTGRRVNIRQIFQRIVELTDVYVLVLGTLAVLVYGWILLASYYLPPRGIDDIVYHLPAVYEYVQSHEIKLLPLDMRGYFAFPENAELLFMWPVIFTHSQRWVDGVNVIFVLFSVLTIYAILRHFDLPQKNAMFAALMYAFCPVVLMQSGGNYIDIIVSFFLLSGIYFALSFYKDQRIGYLLMTAITTGLMCGMKYTAVFLALPLQLLVIPGLLRGKYYHTAWYLLIILITGGWWYTRNLFVLGNPFYEFEGVTFIGMRHPGFISGILWNIAYNIPYWVVRYPLMDSGVGTYDGGFGLAFWGFCFLSWIYIFVKSLFLRNKARAAKLLVLSYLPLGLLMLLCMSPRGIDFAGRNAMFIVAVGLFAFCEVIDAFQEHAYTAALKTISIVMSIFSVSLMSVSRMPPYKLGDVYSDKIHRIESSEFKYLKNAHDVHAVLSSAWESLDYISVADHGGLSCFIASDSVLYAPAPVYGSRLQNHVLNMSKQRPDIVDAYICTYLNKDNLNIPLTKHGTISDRNLQGATTIADILDKPEYVTVFQDDHASFRVHSAVFQRPGIQHRLALWYRDTWPEACATAQQLSVRLDHTVPLIASSDLGYGIRTADMSSGTPNRVYMTLDDREDALAAGLKGDRFYTLRPMKGYLSQRIAQTTYQGKVVNIFLNRRI